MRFTFFIEARGTVPVHRERTSRRPCSSRRTVLSPAATPERENSMVYDFPSPEWAAAYKDAINANAAYKSAAKDWTHGSVAMVVKADPALRIEEDTALLLDMHQGECR